MFKKMYRQKQLSFLLAFVFLMSINFLAGCGPEKAQPVPRTALKTPTVRLSAGDVIEVKFPYADQFNEVLTIRPDGLIALPLVGEVNAAGKTPSELREQLTRLHAEYLQHPDLAVIVRSLYERKVYVGGAVNEPGLVEMPGNLTVLDAIMEAGGFDLITAAVDSVVLIRYREGEKPIGRRVPLESAIEGKGYEPVYLESRDIVYVPRTTIVEIGQWVNQHIYDLLPLTGFGVGYSID